MVTSCNFSSGVRLYFLYFPQKYFYSIDYYCTRIFQLEKAVMVHFCFSKFVPNSLSEKGNKYFLDWAISY